MSTDVLVARLLNKAELGLDSKDDPRIAPIQVANYSKAQLNAQIKTFPDLLKEFDIAEASLNVLKGVKTTTAAEQAKALEKTLGTKTNLSSYTTKKDSLVNRKDKLEEELENVKKGVRGTSTASEVRLSSDTTKKKNASEEKVESLDKGITASKNESSIQLPVELKKIKQGQEILAKDIEMEREKSAAELKRIQALAVTIYSQLAPTQREMVPPPTLHSGG